MNFKTILAAAFAVALSCVQAFGQATILPPGETCFSALGATSGGPTNTGTGYVGLLGTITGGTLYTAGTYGGVALTGGSGSGATANITVSGGAVTTVVILNPGNSYVVGDVLSASAASIGGTGSGFSVPVSSVAINSALAGGTVGFYIPSTLTTKQTWQNSGQTILNTNPVGLDINGCAIIYGVGTYRMILKDSLGSTVYDQLTAATNGSNGIFWAALAGGTGNAITAVDTAFANQDGYNLQFLASACNNGPATIAVSGGTPIAIVKDTSSGPAALTGNEICTGNTPMLTYDATNVEFHLVNPSTGTSGGSGSTSSLTPPQGYLNLVGQASGGVVQINDVIGTSTVYYSPFVGNTIPIWNGSVFKQIVFSELTATLTVAGSAVNAIQDECVFSNNGVPTLVTGPAWTTPTAGAGSRGTGAGTAQLNKLQGIWVNAVSITGYNGLSSYSIPANQCTFVGSLYIDGTAGQVTAHRSYGQNRKFGIWNAYNRQPIVLFGGDPGVSWNYGVSQVRASDGLPAAFTGTGCNVGGGSTCNSLIVFSGLAEEQIATSLIQTTASNSNSATVWKSGIGVNSTTAFSGTVGQINDIANQSGMSFAITSAFDVAPALGISIVFSLENANSGVSTAFDGTQGSMLLRAQWRG